MRGDEEKHKRCYILALADAVHEEVTLGLALVVLLQHAVMVERTRGTHARLVRHQMSSITYTLRRTRGEI